VQPTDRRPSIDTGLVASLRGLDRDGRLLFLTRVLRMFGYGFLAVVLVLYLDALGLDALTIGTILTLTLVGDTLISLWLTTQADRIGRRRVLVAGAVLMVVAGVVFAATSWVPLLILAATIGVISPTGNEVGPFLAVEQAALSDRCADGARVVGALRGIGVEAVDCFRQQARHRRLARAARAGKEISVRDAAGSDRVVHRLHDVLLADDIVERLGPPLAIKRLCHRISRE